MPKGGKPGVARDPEYYGRDDGCPDRRYTSCLNCPLPVCRFETGPYKHDQQRSRSTGVRVRQLYDEGHLAAEIAEMVGLSKRTVFRHLSLSGVEL